MAAKVGPRLGPVDVVSSIPRSRVRGEYNASLRRTLTFPNYWICAREVQGAQRRVGWLMLLLPGRDIGPIAATLPRRPAIVDHSVGQEGVGAGGLADPDVALCGS